MGGFKREIPDCLWYVAYKDTGAQASVGSYESYRFYEREDLAYKAIKRHSHWDAARFGYPQVEELEVRCVWLVEAESSISPAVIPIVSSTSQDST